jgi:hypothetical protein
MTDQDKGEELDKNPTVHCGGRVDPQSFHVKLFFQVVKKTYTAQINSPISA